MTDRIESGSIQFGDDWPGLFLRGDDALNFASHLDEVLSKSTGDFLALQVVSGLLADLKSVRGDPVTRIRKWKLAKTSVCRRCGGSGIIETGNNYLPCECPAGDRAQFSVAGGGVVTGAELKRRRGYHG